MKADTFPPYEGEDKEALAVLLKELSEMRDVQARQRRALLAITMNATPWSREAMIDVALAAILHRQGDY